MKNLIIAILAVGFITATIIACGLNQTKTVRPDNQADLSKQLAGLQTQNAELAEQIQKLTATNTVQFDQKSELQIVNAALIKQRSEMEGTNAALVAQIAGLKTNLDHAVSQSATYSNQLAQAKTVAPSAAPVADQTPTVPIIVSTRAAHLGKGQVLILKNTSGQLLAVQVRCASETGVEKIFHVEVSPKSPKEIGWLQGWAAAAGDQVSVHADGYADVHWDIN